MADKKIQPTNPNTTATPDSSSDPAQRTTANARIFRKAASVRAFRKAASIRFGRKTNGGRFI